MYYVGCDDGVTWLLRKRGRRDLSCLVSVFLSSFRFLVVCLFPRVGFLCRVSMLPEGVHPCFSLCFICIPRRCCHGAYCFDASSHAFPAIGRQNLAYSS